MSGISLAKAIDQYSEDQKKKEYVQDVLDEYRDFMDSADENADEVANVAAGVALFFGDSADDVAFAYNIAHDVAYEYYLYDNDFDDWVEGIDEPDFQIKFDQADFQRDLKNNYENIIEDNYDQHLQNSAWNIVNNVYSYGKGGGFESWGEEKPEGYYSARNIWDRAKNTTREMFGLETNKIQLPTGFDSHEDWLSNVLERHKAGESLDQILTKTQQRQLGLIGEDPMIQLLQRGRTSSSPPAPGQN